MSQGLWLCWQLHIDWVVLNLEKDKNKHKVELSQHYITFLSITISSILKITTTITITYYYVLPNVWCVCVHVRVCVCVCLCVCVCVRERERDSLRKLVRSGLRLLRNKLQLDSCRKHFKRLAINSGSASTMSLLSSWPTTSNKDLTTALANWVSCSTTEWSELTFVSGPMRFSRTS